MDSRYPLTEHTRHHRMPARGSHERAVVHAILDEALVVHVGLVVGGRPFVLPMAFARVGETLFLHGAAASRLQKGLASGVPACATATLLDGLVYSRSQFHHSMNYRSALVLGTAREVIGDDEKRRALAAIVDRVSPSRSLFARPPTEKELAATSVVALAIEEASAKIREGGPKEDEADLGLPGFSGVTPVRLVAGATSASHPSDLAPPPPGFLR